MVVSLNLSFNAIVIIQINISHSSTQNYEKQKNASNQSIVNITDIHSHARASFDYTLFTCVEKLKAK